MPSRTPAISLLDLTKNYGRTTAVNGLSIEVNTGQVFGFLGPNGAGKSTTIRMIMGLAAPTAGRVHVLGADAWDDGPSIRGRVGYLAGELVLPPRLTGRAILEWAARARGARNLDARHELAERFGAELDRPVRKLSKGNRQKIGIIRAFEHDPELLVLDEPTSGLDPLLQQEFAAVLEERVASGRTVFLSSHDLSEVQQLAHHIAIIRKGELVLKDTVDSLRARAPRSIVLTFAHRVDPAEFSRLPGVGLVGSGDRRLELSATGEVGPLLAAAARNGVVDIEARPPDLEELFRTFYASAEAHVAW